jgi:Ca2+-binding EF-hand superfamily protein
MRILLQYLLVALSIFLILSYKAEKVVEHFQAVDVNSDGKLGR